MPTGYTATLCEKEQPFGEFVLGCARAFGACVMQRDDPMTDLPKAEPMSSHHADELAKDEKKLEKLLALPRSAQVKLGRKKKNTQIDYYRDQIAKHVIIRDRLTAMLDKVNAWKPPTPEHEGLKTFMVEQLISTIKHDGDVEYYGEQLSKELAKTPADYYQEEIKSAKWNVEYHNKELAKEQERHSDRSKWISDLFQSLHGTDNGELMWLLLNKKDL